MKIKCKKCGWVPTKEGFIFVIGPLNQTLICIVCDNEIKVFEKSVKSKETFMKDKRLREALNDFGVIHIPIEGTPNRGFELHAMGLEIDKLKDQIAGILDFLAIEEVPYSERPKIDYYREKKAVKGD